MATNQGIQLVDPEGTELNIARIDDAVFVATITPAGAIFRMFEEDREKLKSFLRPLIG